LKFLISSIQRQGNGELQQLLPEAEGIEFDQGRGEWI